MSTTSRDALAMETGDSYETIFDRCRVIAEATAKLNLLNSFAYYKSVIDRLASRKNLAIVPIAGICSLSSGGQKSLAFRHDIDADIVTAVRCAAHLKEQRLPGSFYVLHTSHYYGSFAGENSGFLRHEGFRAFLRELNASGCEIGIHNDALGIHFDHDLDGTEIFVRELAWLRSEGVEISGSAAHNSAAVYGAECFEIFKGLAVGNRSILHWRGKSIRLQTLDMAALGLKYEANHPLPRAHLDLAKMRLIASIDGDALRQPKWQKSYFADHPVYERGYDYDAWLIASDTWILAGKGTVAHPMTLDRLLETIDLLPDRARIVVSIHPIYVGERSTRSDT